MPVSFIFSFFSVRAKDLKVSDVAEVPLSTERTKQKKQTDSVSCVQQLLITRYQNKYFSHY